MDETKYKVGDRLPKRVFIGENLFATAYDNAGALLIVEACNNYSRLREDNAALVEALGIISMFPITHPMSNQDAANMQQIATAALAKSREGNGGNNG